MNNGDAKSADVIERQREMAGQRTALPISDPEDWSGRIVTIIAAGRGADGTAAQRRVVELTGNAQRPYVLRWGG